MAGDTTTEDSQRTAMTVENIHQMHDAITDQGHEVSPHSHLHASVENADEASVNHILKAINQVQQEIQNSVCSNEPMPINRRRNVDQRLKELKDLARHNAEIAQIAQEQQFQDN